MESDVMTGWAEDGQERKLLRFLNRVFYHNQLFPRFLRLLPQLYKTEYHPCPNNLVVWDRKRFRAAVGLYMIDFEAGQEKLLAGGIGNVAVGKRYRGRGYMKLLMRQAMEECQARGADFAVLAGLRHRYQYFGFERVGGVNSYKVTKTNLRHVLRTKQHVPLKASRLRPDDTASLHAIFALNEAAPLHCARPKDPSAHWDTLRSWFCVPYVLRCGKEFAGYFIYTPVIRRVEEFRVTDPDHLCGAIPAIFTALKKSGLRFKMAPAENEINAFLNELCESVHVECPEHFCIYNYERVLESLLRLRAQAAPLCEGALVFQMNGYMREETLCISVQGGEISVTPTEELPAVTLDHLAAMRCFFAPVSSERSALPAFAASWFPLPLSFPYTDMV